MSYGQILSERTLLKVFRNSYKFLWIALLAAGDHSTVAWMSGEDIYCANSPFSTGNHTGASMNRHAFNTSRMLPNLIQSHLDDVAYGGPSDSVDASRSSVSPTSVMDLTRRTSTDSFNHLIHSPGSFSENEDNAPISAHSSSPVTFANANTNINPTPSRRRRHNPSTLLHSYNQIYPKRLGLDEMCFPTYIHSMKGLIMELVTRKHVQQREDYAKDLFIKAKIQFQQWKTDHPFEEDVVFWDGQCVFESKGIYS